MIITITYYIFISFVFIFTVHNIYEYFKDMLTVPKEKDLITRPKETYTKIYESIQQNEHHDKDNKKNNLKQYLKTLGYNNSQNGNTIDSIDNNDDVEPTGDTIFK